LRALPGLLRNRPRPRPAIARRRRESAWFSKSCTARALRGRASRTTALAVPRRQPLHRIPPHRLRRSPARAPPPRTAACPSC